MRKIQNTAFINQRLSYAGRPVYPLLPGIFPSILSHNLSDMSCLCIIFLSPNNTIIISDIFLLIDALTTDSMANSWPVNRVQKLLTYSTRADTGQNQKR